MNKIKILLFTVAIIAFGGMTAFSQDSNVESKRALISEFRRLTGADRVNLTVNVSTDIRDDLNSLLEEEKEITDEQKQELKKSISDANERVDKAVKDFLTDEKAMTALSEEIIYQIYDKNFTDSELKELITFYQTPVGKKAAAFLPTLSKQVEKAFSDSVVAKLQVLVGPKIQAEITEFKVKLKGLNKN